MNNIDKYFAGEKLQCVIGIGISIISVCIAIYFLTTEKTLLKGIAYPFIAISIILFSICLGVVIRTPKDILRVSEYANMEPIKLKSDELPRMEKVMANFKTIKLIEIGLLAIGLVLIFVFWNYNLLKGIGIGLAIQASIMLTFDLSAETRGHTYLTYLKTQ